MLTTAEWVEALTKVHQVTALAFRERTIVAFLDTLALEGRSEEDLARYEREIRSKVLIYL